MSNSSSSSGGIGFCGLLTVLFVGLKLTAYIAWSWLWVLAPLWIPFAGVLSVMLVFGAFIGTLALFQAFWPFFSRKKKR